MLGRYSQRETPMDCPNPLSPKVRLELRAGWGHQIARNRRGVDRAGSVRDDPFRQRGTFMGGPIARSP